MIDKETLNIARKATTPIGEEARKNIKTNKVKPIATAAKETSHKKSFKEIIKDIMSLLVYAFSEDVVICNGKDASNAIQKFILKFIGVNFLYIACFALIILIPIKCGYIPSMIMALPIVALFIISIVMNVCKLYGTYIVPVKRYREYKKTHDTGIM